MLGWYHFFPALSAADVAKYHCTEGVDWQKGLKMENHCAHEVRPERPGTQVLEQTQCQELAVFLPLPSCFSIIHCLLASSSQLRCCFFFYFVDFGKKLVTTQFLFFWISNFFICFDQLSITWIFDRKNFDPSMKRSIEKKKKKKKKKKLSSKKTKNDTGGSLFHPFLFLSFHSIAFFTRLVSTLLSMTFTVTLKKELF